MDTIDFISQGFDIHPLIKVTFTNGQEAVGSVGKHFPGDEEFYIISSLHMKSFADNAESFKKTNDADAFKKMQTLAVPIDIDAIAFAEKLPL